LLVSLLSSDGLAPSDLDWLTIRSNGLATTELSGLRLGQIDIANISIFLE